MNGRTSPRRIDTMEDQEAQEFYDLLRSHLSPIWSVDENEIEIPEDEESDLSIYGNSVNWEELR